MQSSWVTCNEKMQLELTSFLRLKTPEIIAKKVNGTSLICIVVCFFFNVKYMNLFSQLYFENDLS